MTRAGFDEGTPVYVASGVFSRNDTVPASEYIAQVQYIFSTAILLHLYTVEAWERWMRNSRRCNTC